MTKLSELKSHYARAPKMLSAVTNAVADHGPNADAIVVSGLPSKTCKISNMYKACAVEMGWDNWDYYYGAHRQRGTQGWVFVCVKNLENLKS
jgi:hypothetical protein